MIGPRCVNSHFGYNCMLILLLIKWHTFHIWLRQNARNAWDMKFRFLVPWVDRSLSTRIAGISSRIIKTRSPRSNTRPTLVSRRRVKWVYDSAMQVLPATAWSICIGSSSLFSFSETPRFLNFFKSLEEWESWRHLNLRSRRTRDTLQRKLGPLPWIWTW